MSLLVPNAAEFPDPLLVRLLAEDGRETFPSIRRGSRSQFEVQIDAGWLTPGTYTLELHTDDIPIEPQVETDDSDEEY